MLAERRIAIASPVIRFRIVTIEPDHLGEFSGRLLVTHQRRIGPAPIAIGRRHHRVEASRLAKVGDRLFVLARRQQRFAAGVVDLRVLCIGLNRLIEIGHGLVVSVEPGIDPTADVMIGRDVITQSNRRAVIGGSFFIIANRLIHAAAVVVVAGEFSLGANRCREIFDRLGVLRRAAIGVAPGVIDHGAALGKLDRHAGVGDDLFVVFNRRVRQRPFHVTDGILGQHPNRQREVVNRLLVLLPKRVDHAAVLIGLGRLGVSAEDIGVFSQRPFDERRGELAIGVGPRRIEPDRLADVFDGTSPLALASQRAATPGVRVGIALVGLDRQVAVFHRAVELPVFQIGQAAAAIAWPDLMVRGFDQRLRVG